MCVCVAQWKLKISYMQVFVQCRRGKLGQSVICLVIQTKTTTTASVFKTDGINNAIILAGWGWQCYCPKLRLIVYL